MSDKPLILVTGATGNSGSGLVPALLAAGARVRALVRDHVPFSAARESMVGMGMAPWIAEAYVERGDKTSGDTEALLGHPARIHQPFCADFKTAFAAA